MKINVINQILDKINIEKAYNNILQETPNQFTKIVDESVKCESIRAQKREMVNHIRKDENGPILINNENYKVNRSYFNILHRALKNTIKLEAVKYFDLLKNTEIYSKAKVTEKRSILNIFTDMLTLRLHKHYSRIRYIRKVESGEYGKKPERTNHNSKEAYVKNSIESSFIEEYMDSYVNLVDANVKMESL